MDDAKLGSTRIVVYLLVFSFFGCGFLSLAIGHDANWDLRNYHYYNPYMVFHNRLSIDHNVAGIQTYLNPTLDMLTTYPLIRFFGAAGYSFILGAIHGINFFLIVLIALELMNYYDFLSYKYRVFLAILAGALGMSGAMASSEIGTCFGDLTLSPLNLGGLWLAIKSFQSRDDKNRILSIAVCGLVIGLSIGFKLINGPYGVAIVTAVLLKWGRGRLRALSALIVCLILGIVITHGWWFLFLFMHYQNPIFPFFNGIFHSPYIDPTNHRDLRFFPHGWAQHLFYPFFFSRKHLTAEIWFRDFRFPLAYICVLSILVSSAVPVLRKQKSATKISPSFIFLITFIVAAYIIWQRLFSIQRYLISVELLLPVVILITCLTLLRKWGAGAFILVGLFLVLTTEVASWGRIDLTKGPFNKISQNNPAAIISNSVIILGDRPLGYLVPTFNLSNTAWLGAPFSSPDREVAMRKLNSQLDEREAFVVDIYGKVDKANSVLQRYGMPETAGDNCLVFTTNAGPEIILCSAVPPTNFQVVRLNRPWTIPSTWSGFSVQEKWGSWTVGTEARMVFKLNRPITQDLEMTINGKALVTNTHRQRLSVAVNGHLVDRQVLDVASPSPKPVPIPAGILGNNEMVVIELNLPDAAAPKKLGINDDGRLLGLGVRWVAIHPANRPPRIEAVK